MLPQLAIWHISGRDTEVSSFRRKLHSFRLAPAGQKQTNPITHYLLSGTAGVLCCVQFP